MTRSVSIAELKAHLSEVLGQVQNNGDSVLIEKHGRGVAMLVPLSVTTPRGLLGLVGAFEDAPHLADEIDEVVKLRRTEKRRKVPTLK